MQVITDEHEAKRAYRELERQLTGLGEHHVRTLGYPGGHEPDMDVYWSEKHGIWAHANDTTALGRYWICFGTALGKPSNSLGITLECNPPMSGTNRRTAGVFLTDGKNRFLAHSGKIGGGKKGIGKSEFLAWYDGGGIRSVRWPGGKTSELIVIGRIGSDAFPAQLARFVRSVEAFKQGLPAQEGPTHHEVFFTPEFSGSKAYEVAKRSIDAKYSHGAVVDALKLLLDGDHLVGTDQHRDLFCADRNGQVSALFEVKTSANTTSVYGGVGQLFIHGTELSARTPRILVLPESPKGKLLGALEKLGVSVLTYTLTEGVVAFDGGKRAVQRLLETR
jgi:hypothetical protein